MTNNGDTVMAKPNFLKNANEAVDRYSERWQEDHYQAMACMEFEELIAFGISVSGLIDRVNEVWRENVRKSPQIYDEAIDKQIENLYLRWLEPCPKVRELLRNFQDQGFSVVGADEFRAACAHVERTAKLFEGLRIGKDQLDRGERIPLSDVRKQVAAK